MQAYRALSQIYHLLILACFSPGLKCTPQAPKQPLFLSTSHQARQAQEHILRTLSAYRLHIRTSAHLRPHSHPSPHPDAPRSATALQQAHGRHHMLLPHILPADDLSFHSASFSVFRCEAAGISPTRQ
ncbi:unnamed protein product [Protopolystoma xenopodis]|uniref:Secreted protein n=1 Tax=Protopolystoma xenopodis TaxID=117903 RepID=A0A448XGE1_9PLAT|nr:unnamed protein product [Protopolystoma xenopodis]